MKQIKMWVFGLILLIGIGFTSCMEENNNTMANGAAIVKINTLLGATYFTNNLGFKYYPTSASLEKVKTNMRFNPQGTTIAYIFFSFDTATQKVTEDTKSLNIDLSYAVSLDATFEVVHEKGASNDSINKAPIISLGETYSGNYEEKPFMFNESILILPINYYMNTDGHHFTLLNYAFGTEDMSDGVPLLHLRHNNNKDTSLSTTSKLMSHQYPYVYYKAFDLSKLQSLKAAKKLKIMTKENNTNLNMDGAVDKAYEVNFKSEK